jgi:hypothetical protein
MAFQVSMLKFEGRIDDLVFYKSGQSYRVRKKGGVSGDRIKKDPVFANLRDNMSEFGRASKAAKLLRRAFRMELADVCDSAVAMRTTQAMSRIIKSDRVSDRGRRTLLQGEIELLSGLQFNRHVSMEQAFKAPFTTSIDRRAGTLTVDIPAFASGACISKPVGATHFRLFASAGELDFETEHCVSTSSSTPDLLVDSLQSEIKLVCELSVANTKTLVLALGITFSRVDKGKLQSLKGAGQNALAIVMVERDDVYCR